MASWKENKMMGIVAGVVFILAIIVMVALLKPRAPAVTGTGTLETPATTPYVK